MLQVRQVSHVCKIRVEFYSPYDHVQMVPKFFMLISGTRGESGGQTGVTYDISNKHRLGYTEVLPADFSSYFTQNALKIQILLATSVPDP